MVLKSKAAKDTLLIKSTSTLPVTLLTSAIVKHLPFLKFIIVFEIIFCTDQLLTTVKLAL